MRTTIGVACLLLLVGATPLAALSPSHIWSQNFGTTTGNIGQKVAVDALGNVHVTGSFVGSVDFGGGVLTSAGASTTDIFVAKFNSSGVHLWSQRFGGTSSDEGLSIAVDGAGNVIVTGDFLGTVDFGGGPLASAGVLDIFVAKFNSSGLHQWSKRFGSNGTDQGYGVAAEVDGTVFITGRFSTMVDFGGGVLASVGSTDIYLAKYNFAGTHQWSQRFGGTSVDEGNVVATDASGNVILTGDFATTVDFGGGPLVSAGNFDVFIAKFNSAGVHQWSSRFGAGSSDVGAAVAVDGTGNVVVTGRFTGTVDFGGGSLVSAGNTDIFVAKYNSSGTHQWSQGFGGSSADVGNSVAVDGSGNVFATGFFRQTADFGGGPLVASGDDIFVAKYTSSGFHQWSQRFGGAAGDVGYGVAADASGNMLMTGQFSGPVDFGGGPLTTVASYDMVLAKYGVDVAEPVITEVSDVGNDQGRRVRISFEHSGHDLMGIFPRVVRYEAFRRVDTLPAAPVDGESRSSLLAAGWDFAGDVPAHQEADYEILVETLADSTVALGMHESVFLIRAATDVPEKFYDSPRDSGYSIDNLAPSAPGDFAYNAGVLSWDESKDADFDYFSVYGSASAVLDVTAVLLDQTIDTSLDVSSSPHVFYYATATDFSGNEGRASRVNTLSGTGEAPARYSLGVNAYPNPFNPATTIRYDVPSRGRVVVRVYDAKGSRVRTLVDGEREAGSYPVEWNGVDDRGLSASSGVYFVRLEFGAQTRAKKVVLLK